LQIGYRGIIGGKAGATLVAGAKAKQLSQDGTPEQARAALYRAMTGQHESGVAELNSVDAGRLSQQDVELKNATTSLAKVIGDPSGKASGPAAPEPTKAAIIFADASSALALP
jgi:hypothetical protein